MRVSLPTVSVEQANVTDYQCEVLVLKYAQAWYGADAAAARKLDLRSDGPEPWNFQFVHPTERSWARHILFEGVPPLRQLTYSIVRKFGRNAIEHLHQEMPRVKHVAMTLHGISVGLDEREVFLSQLSGVVESLRAGALPDLQKLTFVEMNPKRAARLAALLKDNQPNFKPVVSSVEAVATGQAAGGPGAGVSATPVGEPVEKPHVFVAMPFTEGMEDVFIFGIQTPVQNAGLLCERVDMAVFSGDILERIKSRIESSSLVIADLSTANANVYLEVGYAWGMNKDTLLLCRNVDDLKFDVRGQRCLIYSSINDLHKKLTEELKMRIPSRV